MFLRPLLVRIILIKLLKTHKKLVQLILNNDSQKAGINKLTKVFIIAKGHFGHLIKDLVLIEKGTEQK